MECPLSAATGQILSEVFKSIPAARTSKPKSLHSLSRVYPVASAMKQDRLIDRISSNPDIFGGKPIIRGRRLAVEHVLDMLAAGDDPATILKGFRGWSRRTSKHAWSMH
jgi:uncharacterized protein (DUF433 family)